MDDGCDAHAAAGCSVSFFEVDGGAVPQPDQVFILVGAAINLTNQRHGLAQLCQYNAIVAGFWGRLDQDTFGQMEMVRGDNAEAHDLMTRSSYPTPGLYNSTRASGEEAV